MTIKRSFEQRIVWLIAIITAINFFDRSAISFAIGPIEKELGLTNAQFGVVASGFGIGLFAMAFFAGILVEKYNSIRIWAFSAIFWSLATAAMSLVEGFSSILILRVLLGIAEGVTFPALLKTIADWLEPSYRARAISLGLLGVPLASLIGAPFITFLIQAFGWRGMFVILGSLGIIWAFLWLLVFRGRKNPKRGALPNEYLQTSVPVGHKIPWKAFFTSIPFLGNCFIYFIFGYILFFVLIWLPGYLEQIHHTTLGKTGILVMGPWLLGSVTILLGGWASDFLMKRHSQRGRTYPIGAGMLFASVSFFLLFASTSLTFNLWMMSLGLGFAMFANSPIYALNSDLFPHHAGAAQGIATCFFAFAGIISPSLTGLMVEVSGSFQSAIFLVATLAAVAGITALFIPKKQM
jgi:ACS family hexuronate transporter-like MFS transporter